MREELAHATAAPGVDGAVAAATAPAAAPAAAALGPLVERLQLQEAAHHCSEQQQAHSTITTAAVKHVQAAFGDLLSLSPTALFTPLLAAGGQGAAAAQQEDGAAAAREREARYWSVFADVYEQELRARSALAHQHRDQNGALQADAEQQPEVHQQQQQEQALSKDAKRQILADILVWAEITQSHYDSTTASFVTEPHDGDASFQRIGQLFKAAKKQRGLA